MCLGTPMVDPSQAIHAGAVHDARVLGVVLVAKHFFVEELNIAGNQCHQADL